MDDKIPRSDSDVDGGSGLNERLATFQRARRKAWGISIATPVALMFLLAAVSSSPLVSSTLANVLEWVCLIVSAVIIMVTMLKSNKARCPRCSHSAYISVQGQWNNTLARRCVNCGQRLAPSRPVTKRQSQESISECSVDRRDGSDPWSPCTC